MASSFSVTTASNSVRLDDSRRAQVSFTVYNASGRGVRGRVRLVPLQPEAEGWLSVAGDPRRDYAIAGTVQYSVAIAVPPDAVAGPYTFRLDAIGEDNPDEDYTAGPTVTFTVPEPEAREARPFPWWIVAVAAAVVLVVGITTALLWPRSATVPDVGGLALVPAVEEIERAGLLVDEETDEEHSQTVSRNLVIRTNPPAGESVGRGTVVRLVLSAGPGLTTVPNVSGQAVDEATRSLQRAGLTVGGEEQAPSRRVAEGRVIRTEPAAGVEVEVESGVVLVVATAPGPLPAPVHVSPPDGTVFDHFPRTTTLTWRPVDGASSYVVERTFLNPGQSCRPDADAREPFVESGITETSHTFNFVGAQPGCWRVAAVAEDGTTGAKSAWWQFTYTR